MINCFGSRDKSFKTAGVSLDIGWATWDLRHEDRGFDNNPPRLKNINASDFHPSTKDVLCYGLAMSPFLNVVAAWIGSGLWFFTTNPGVLELMDWAVKQDLENDPCHGLCCIDVRFSPCSRIAIAMWGTGPTRGEDMKHIHGKLVRMYQFTGGEVIPTCALSIECEPRTYCFHPYLKLVAITLQDGVRLYDFNDPYEPHLIRELTKDCINSYMNVNFVEDEKNNVASPPSTNQTVQLQKDDGQSPCVACMSLCAL